MIAKEIVKKIYEDYGFTDPIELDLELIANNNRLIIQRADLEEVDGIIIFNNYGGIIKVNKNIRDSGWFRFTVAHELGHFLYFKLYDRDIQQFKIKYSSQQLNFQEEKFVNEFASELLMPEKYFVEFIKNKKLDINLLKNIKSRFNVSLPAAAVRYTQLGKEPIAVIFSRRGKIKWKFESKDFPLKFIKYYSDIPENSGALEIFISKEESIKKLVSPNTWYKKDFNLIKYVNVKIEELSVFLPDNESILTVLKI